MSKRVFAVLLVSLIILSLPGMRFGQAKGWESIGPEGGIIVSLIQDQVNPSLFWAATGGKPSKLYQSLDRCVTWSELASWDDGIARVLATPARPGWLFAYSQGGPLDLGDTSAVMKALPGMLYSSSDRGKTWTSRAFPPIYTIQLVQIDPKDGSTIHALAQARANAGVVYLKSTDGGSTWSTTALVQRMGWITAFAVDPRNPSIIYAGVNPPRMTTDTKMLLKSTNGGKDFFGVALSMEKIQGAISDVTIDPGVQGTLYVTTYNRIYRTKEDGNTWEKISGFAGMAQKLWIDPNDPRHLIVASDKSLSESRDGGDSWKTSQAKRAGRGTTALIVDSGAKQVIFTATSAGIYRTEDGGKRWIVSHRGIKETQVTALCTVPSAPGTVFAGLMMNAVYKTTSGSATDVGWQQLPVFYTCTSIADIKTDTRKTYRIIALEGGG